MSNNKRRSAREKEESKMTAWIELFKQDRRSCARIMRENLAADLVAGRSFNYVCHEMLKIEEYEAETDILLERFGRLGDPEAAAKRHLIRVGAISGE